MEYGKLQRLSRTKVSQFTGFYHNVEKTFMAFEYYYIGTQNCTYKIISRENFHSSSGKIHENRKSFLPLNFCCLWQCLR